VQDFLLDFFAKTPIGSVASEGIRIPNDFYERFAKWANFLSKARAEVKCEKEGEGKSKDWTPIAIGTPEAPHKIVDYFKDLARGHSLIEGRTELNDSDLALVGHVAISSVPGHLRPILRKLREAEEVDVMESAVACAVGRKAARRYMSELTLLGIVEVTKGSPQTQDRDTAKLSPKFTWLKT